MGRTCGIYRRGVLIGCWWGDLVERDHQEDSGIDGRIILKWILKKWDGEAWTGLLWLKIVIGGGCLRML